MYSAERRDCISRYNVPVLNCEVVMTISIDGIFQATIRNDFQGEYRPARMELKKISTEDSESPSVSIESMK